MSPEDEILSTAQKRARWASTALAASAEQLRELDGERADAFAAEAQRVAGLMDAGGVRITRRGAWS